jgi:hypothetical protein
VRTKRPNHIVGAEARDVTNRRAIRAQLGGQFDGEGPGFLSSMDVMLDKIVF